MLPQIIPSSVFGMGGRIAPSDRIVIGSIGTGSQGMSNMRDFLKLKDAVQFVAVCDVDAKHLAIAKETVDLANKNSAIAVPMAIIAISSKKKNLTLFLLLYLIIGMV